jgi:hypothetical protein
MIKFRIERLKAMRRDEIEFRATVAARIHQQRLASFIRTPRWRRTDLGSILTSGIADGLRDAIGRQQWDVVQQVLAFEMRQRPSRFVLEPQSAPALRREIVRRWPSAERDAASHADRIIAGKYDLLGYQDLSFAHDGASPDWHFDPVHGRGCPLRFWADVSYLDPGCGDHKLIWELNRHQHWLVLGRALWLTGDERYADEIVAQLRSWLAVNPPLTGVNWASMLELGFRSMSWVWAAHFLLGRPDLDGQGPWLVDLLVALDRQLTHVERNLSRYFSPNTHLTGEGLALYVCGTALPELARSSHWAQTGRRVLLEEIRKQIGADGGHAERSTHYHRYTLDFYLLALLTAERAGDIEAALAFTDAATRLAGYMRAIADDRGWMQPIGDDDGGMVWPITGRDPRDLRDSMALAAAVLERPELNPWGPAEEPFWIAMSARESTLTGSAGVPRTGQARPREVRTDVFADTGYAVIRDPRGDHLVFDVGAHGYLNGGHAHADALAVTLGVAERPLLIDPGTATYTMDPVIRDRLRSTAAHNTLTVDGRPSSVPAGPFHWRSRTDSHLEGWRRNPRLAVIDASHDGFAPLRHRRTVVHSLEGGWLLVDELDGAGEHTAHAHWHFAPEWQVRCETNRLRATDPVGRTAWVLHDAGSLWLVYGDAESGLGWCSPRYGGLVPTWTARVSRTAAAPFSMTTWIGQGTIIETPPSLDRLQTASESDASAVAVQVRQKDRSTITMVRRGPPAAADERSCTVADYRTNARVLQYSLVNDRLQTIALTDGDHAVALRSSLVSVAADGPITDLHATLSGDCVELYCSTPPVELRLQGDAMAAITTVRLNGRDHRIVRAGRPDTVTVAAGEWAEAGRDGGSPFGTEREHEPVGAGWWPRIGTAE